MTISFVDSRTAVISAVREEGTGDLDLYKISFDDIDGRNYLRGFVMEPIA